MKKTIRISDDINDKIKDLSKQLNITESRVIELAIQKFGSEDDHIGLEDQLSIMIKKLNILDQSGYHQLNMLNSLAENLGFENYCDQDILPHRWLSESRNSYQNKARNNRTRKMIKNDEQ